MTSDEFVRLCHQAIEDVRAFVDIETSQHDSPEVKSTAWKEYFTSTETRVDTQPWGMSVPQYANSVGELMLMAAAQFVAALGQLLPPDQPIAAFGFEAVTRSVIEACARAWWIYNPTVDIRARVGRAYTVELFSMNEGMKAEKASGRGTTEFQDARDDIIKQATELGLTIDYSKAKTPVLIGFEGQRRPTPPFSHTRASGYWAAIVVGLLVLVVLLIFILENGQCAKSLFLRRPYSTPEGVALLLAAGIGGLFVVLAGAARILQLRSRAQDQLKEKPRQRHGEGRAVPSGSAGADPR